MGDLAENGFLAHTHTHTEFETTVLAREVKQPKESHQANQTNHTRTVCGASFPHKTATLHLNRVRGH